MTDRTPETPLDDASAVSRRRQRRRRTIAVAAVLTLGLAIFVLVYFEPHTAFIDDEVSETIPGLDAVLAVEVTATAVTSAAAETPATAAPDTTVSTTTATQPVDTSSPPPAASSPPPAASSPPSSVPGNSIAAGLATASATATPVVLSSGSFFSGEHATSGTALVVALPDGSLVVRFEGLDTSNGPDLRVVLSPDEASESWEYSDRLILDELKGNIGDQNYVVGPDVDLSGYASVVIWCERFSVAFGAAPIAVVA